MPVRMSVNLSAVDPSKAYANDAVVDRAMLRAGGRVRDAARAALTTAGRIDTGRLRNDIRVSTVRRSGRNLEVSVGTDLDYGIYQHEGVDGPVYPRRAKVLRFKPKGSSTFVFAQRVRGFEGVPYLTIGLEALRGGLR